MLASPAAANARDTSRIAPLRLSGIHPTNPAASSVRSFCTPSQPKTIERRMNGHTKKSVRLPTSRRGVKNTMQAKPADATVLRLFVAGATARSHKAILRLRAFCDEHAAERFVLEVIDIYQFPDLAREWQIVATPTLIRVRPDPERRFIGNMTDLTGVFSDVG